MARTWMTAGLAYRGRRLLSAALAILIGAATNAAIRRLWPTEDYRGPIERAGDWWDQVRSGDEPQRPLSAIEDREDPEHLR